MALVPRAVFRLGFRSFCDKAKAVDTASKSEIAKELENSLVKHQLDSFQLEIDKARAEMAAEHSTLIHKAEQDILLDSSKLKQEYYSMMATIEASKFELLKYTLGTSFSLGALVFAFFRMKA